MYGAAAVRLYFSHAGLQAARYKTAGSIRLIHKKAGSIRFGRQGK